MSDPHEPHLQEITQDPDLLRRILDNQANDIITRQTEQEIRRREIETGHEYSLKLLDAQLADKQRDREYLKSANTKGSIADDAEEWLLQRWAWLESPVLPDDDL